MNRPIKTLCLFAMAALAVPLARAADATVNITTDNLNGWTITTGRLGSGTANASVTQTTDYGGQGNFRFYTGAGVQNTSWQWAGISSGDFGGMLLSSISSMSIQEFGFSGDSPNNWEPPTFTWFIDKGNGSPRTVVWVPWNTAFPGGSYGSISTSNSRTPGQWNTYDCATTGTWFVEENGAKYTSLAALKAAFPSGFFLPASRLPASSYLSQQAFNLGNVQVYNADQTMFNNTTGYVDWFEVGVNGTVTRYDLGAAVPEPGALALLALGLGLVALRKKA
jgi:hypothetical protein